MCAILRNVQQSTLYRHRSYLIQQGMKFIQLFPGKRGLRVLKSSLEDYLERKAEQMTKEDQNVPSVLELALKNG